MNFLFYSIDRASFFRISISLLALISILSYGDEYLHLFAGEIIDIKTMNNAAGFKDRMPYELFLQLSHYTETKQVFLIARSVYVVSLIFLFFGLFTRPSAVVAFVSNFFIFYNSPLFIYGYDDFLYLSLLFCCLFRVASTLSIDNIIFRRNVKSSSEYLKPFLGVVLCICYFFSGISKVVDGVGWWNGQKIIYALHQRVSIDKDLTITNFLLEYYFIAVILGIFTLMVELSYPILFYFKKARSLLLFLIIGLHIGIAVMLQLTAFSLIMIIWNIALLYDFENDRKNLSGFWKKVNS